MHEVDIAHGHSRPKGLLDSYLAQLDELDRAIFFLQQLSLNAPLKTASNVLARLKTLKAIGMAECERAFVALLTKTSAALDISKLLDPFPPLFGVSLALSLWCMCHQRQLTHSVADVEHAQRSSVTDRSKNWRC
jgi:hypothetical protein